MNVAENKLNWDMLQSKIHEITSKEKVPGWASKYGNPSGVKSFKEAVANFLETSLFGCTVNQEHLAFSSGLTSTIEQTAFILGNPGDVAVIPAPSYPVYTSDLGVKSGIIRYDLQSHKEIGEIRNGLKLSISDLENAKPK